VSDLRTPALYVPAETMVSEELASRASLTLGHVLSGIGADYDPAVPLEDIHVIRHTFKPGDPDALRGPEDLTQERVLAYTREQDIRPASPQILPLLVILTSDGGRRPPWEPKEPRRQAMSTKSTDADLRRQLLTPQ
jgi:hypothetical protein